MGPLAQGYKQERKSGKGGGTESVVSYWSPRRYGRRSKPKVPFWGWQGHPPVWPFLKALWDIYRGTGVLTPRPQPDMCSIGLFNNWLIALIAY